MTGHIRNRLAKVNGNVGRWAFIFIAALLLSGCITWAEDGTPRGGITGRATVTIGGYTFPLAGARVTAPGTYSTVATNRNGQYSHTRLPTGRQRVTLRPLHGAYERTVFVQEHRLRTVDWDVHANRLNADKFLQLSGLMDIFVDQRGRMDWDYGDLVRWEKRTVSVYFDETGAPRGLPAGTVQRYIAEMNRWESRLDNRVSFVRTRDEGRADIAVYWVPPDSLGDHAGIAYHRAFYANGALKRVEIEIDVQFAQWPGLWEHEFAHAMGAGHLNDKGSVMYPLLLQHQRATLSPDEWAHVRLLYDIPSGQRLPRHSSYGAVIVSDESEYGPFDEDLYEHDFFEQHPPVDLDEQATPDEQSTRSQREDETSDASQRSELAVTVLDAGSATGTREHTLYADPGLLEEWLATEGRL